MGFGKWKESRGISEVIIYYMNILLIFSPLLPASRTRKGTDDPGKQKGLFRRPLMKVIGESSALTWRRR